MSVHKTIRFVTCILTFCVMHFACSASCSKTKQSFTRSKLLMGKSKLYAVVSQSLWYTPLGQVTKPAWVLPVQANEFHLLTSSLAVGLQRGQLRIGAVDENISQCCQMPYSWAELMLCIYVIIVKKWCSNCLSACHLAGYMGQTCSKRPGQTAH